MRNHWRKLNSGGENIFSTRVSPTYISYSHAAVNVGGICHFLPHKVLKTCQFDMFLAQVYIRLSFESNISAQDSLVMLQCVLIFLVNLGSKHMDK